MPRTSVLFLCSGNSARSQMAEALLRHSAGDRFEVHSAGMRPKGIHPLTHQVLNEIGIDSSGQTSKPVSELMGRLSIQVAVILCDTTRVECPSIYPFALRTLYWPFPDPVGAGLSAARQSERFREVRDAIRARLEEWIATGRASSASMSADDDERST